MIKNFFLILILLTFHIFILVNSRFTVWPEMILYPYLMNNGFLLFKDIINPYFPLLSLILSWYFSVVGLSVLNLKIFTYILIILTDLIIFFGGYKLSKSLVNTFLATLTFIFLQLSLGGNGLWFELALTPFLLGSLVVVYKYKSLRSITFAGFLMGLTVLIKQNALIFILPVLIFLMLKKEYKQTFHFIFPILVLFLLTYLYLLNYGLLGDFLSWAILLPLSYANAPGFLLLPAKRQYLFILIPFFSLISLWQKRFNIGDKIFWGLSLSFASFFAFPRYEDFHLQTLVAISGLLSVFLPRKFIAIFLIISLLFFGRNLSRNWQTEDRFLDRDTIELSEKVRNYNSIYLLNGPDLVYFLSNKLPPKPWGINFPWYFEKNNFEAKFIGALSDEKTQKIIIGDRIGGDKYALGNYLPEKLLDFIYSNYMMVEKYKNYQIWMKRE